MKGLAIKIFAGCILATELGLFSSAIATPCEKRVISVDRYETMSDVVQTIAKELNIESDSLDQPLNFQLCVLQHDDRFIIQLAKKPRAAPRSYEAGVTQNEAADIAYIVKTLSNSSLPKIKGAEPSLKKAGDRIDAVHPLQFLLTIFLDEELKVALRNLKGRTWVWSDFLTGLTDTLSEENGKNNILPYLNHFASTLNIDVNAISQFQTNGRWEKFVTTLITIVPRAGNSGRYNQ